MAQITCEAAADTQSQIWVIYIQVFVFVSHVTTVCMDGRSHLPPPPLYGEQTAICGILLWV